MKFTIPKTLQSEHEALHERLRRATEADGEVGEAAKTLAHLMHPHFVKEDAFALPPLGLLIAGPDLEGLADRFFGLGVSAGLGELHGR